MESAEDIMNRLKEQYADDPDTLEWLNRVTVEYLQYPPERARQLALGAEADLLTYA